MSYGMARKWGCWRAFFYNKYGLTINMVRLRAATFRAHILPHEDLEARSVGVEGVVGACAVAAVL